MPRFMFLSSSPDLTKRKHIIMHSTTVIAYTLPNGSLLCPDCLKTAITEAETKGAGWFGNIQPTFDSPVFAGSESDYPMSCDTCLKFIPGSALTSDGREYVKQAIIKAKDNVFVSDVIALWSAEWPDIQQEIDSERNERDREENEMLASELAELKPREWLVSIYRDFAIVRGKFKLTGKVGRTIKTSGPCTWRAILNIEGVTGVGNPAQRDAAGDVYHWIDSAIGKYAKITEVIEDEG